MNPNSAQMAQAGPTTRSNLTAGAEMRDSTLLPRMPENGRPEVPSGRPSRIAVDRQRVALLFTLLPLFAPVSFGLLLPVLEVVDPLLEPLLPNRSLLFRLVL